MFGKEIGFFHLTLFILRPKNDFKAGKFSIIQHIPAFTDKMINIGPICGCIMTQFYFEENRPSQIAKAKANK